MNNSSEFVPVLNSDTHIAVIGLGYVGLPLAIEFGKQYPTIGFDLNQQRIDSLNARVDSTLEVDGQEFQRAKNLSFTASAQDLQNIDVFIVTVPTPITEDKTPDLGALIAASKTVGAHITAGATVIYESTVYPGATEEDCIPVVEQVSGLIANTDFCMAIVRSD